MNAELQPRPLEGLFEIPTGMLVPSPTNPRKAMKGLDELAENMRQVGQVEPAIVRRLGSIFEIVSGERRWRSAELAGLPLVCHVRELTDEHVFDIQIAENNQREDVTPLEEADAIRRGVDGLGRSVEQIAEQLGRSVPFVRERLVLARAPASVRALLAEHLVTVGAAGVLARAPEAKVEAIAGKARKNAEGKGEPLTRRDVALLVDAYARVLAEAPFELNDAKLTRLNARACTTCVDRTGAQGSLFGDVAGDDRCLDAECWEAKLEGLWSRALRDAKKRKLPVLEERWDGTSTGYFESRSPAYAAGVTKPWNDVVQPDEVVIARDEHGRVVELVPPEVIEKYRRPDHVRTSADAPRAPAETEEEREERLARERVERDKVELQRCWSPAFDATLRRLDDDGASDEDILRTIAFTARFSKVHALRLGLIEPGQATSGVELDAWRASASLRELAKFLIADALMDRLFDDPATLDGLLPAVDE